VAGPSHFTTPYIDLSKFQGTHPLRHFHISLRHIAALIFCYAAAVRLCLYLRADASTYDESLLRMAIYGWRPFAPLHPLQFEQTAAPLFVAVSRAITSMWRTDEYGWRLLPLIASILLFPVLYYAVSRLWSRSAAIIAVLLACHHLELFHYSAVFKQYELEAFATAAILAFAGYYRRNGARGKTWQLLLAGGIIAILLCQTAVISLMALLLFVAAQRYLFSVVGERPGEIDREKANVLRWIFICAVLWSAVAITIYSLLYAPVARSVYMQSFWSDSYLNLYGGGLIGQWRHAGGSLLGGLPGPTAVKLPLLLLGIYAIWRRKDVPVLLLITAPCAVTIVLAVLHKYPVEVRLWLFLSPAIIMAVSVGMEEAWHLVRLYTSRYRAAVMAAGVLALLLITPGNSPLAIDLDTVHTLGLMTSPSQASIAVGAVSRMVQSSSCVPVYVGARGLPSWFFYSSQLDAHTDVRFAKIQQLFRFGSPAFGDAPAEAVNVRDPGDWLKLQLGCRSEIYGFGSGTPYRNGLPDAGRTPVIGWAANEINRISRASATSFWLYVGEAGVFELRPLLEEVQHRGYTATEMTIAGKLFMFYVQKYSGAVRSCPRSWGDPPGGTRAP
jgi:hypothetical protein